MRLGPEDATDRRRSSRRHRSLFLLFIVIVALVASLGGRLWPRLPEAGFFLGDKVDHYLDPEGTAHIEDIVALADRFEPANNRMVNRGVQGGAAAVLWLRIKTPALPGPPAEDWTLSLQETRVRDVRVYVEGSAGALREHIVRPGLRDPSTGLVPRFASFDFEASEISGKTIWMRVFTRSSKRALLWLEPREAFVSGELRQTLMFGILSGVLVALFCYLLALGMILKESSLALLAVFVAFFCTYVMSDRAFVESLMFPGALRLSRFASILATLGCYATWTAFLLRYLQTRTHFRWVHATGAGLIGLAGVIAVIAALEVAHDTYNLRRVLPWFGLAIMMTGAFIVLISYWREPTKTLAFAACWSPAIFAVLSRIMLDTNPGGGGSVAAVYSIYVAAVFSVLCFAVVLSLDLQDREYRLRVRAEQQEARFRSFARSASDGFWEADGKGELLSLTGPLSALIKPDGASFVTKLAGLNSDGGKIGILAQALLQRQPFRSVELGLQRPGGEPEMTVEISGEPFWNDGELGGFRGIVSDVSDRKQRQQSEIRQQRMAAIGQLASGIAHEINSLLHPIINLSRRVRDNLSVDDAGRRYLEIVLASGDRARDIVANLLASAHPTKTEVSKVPFLKAVHEICDEIEPLIASQVRLETRIDGEDGPAITKSEAYQVISNLVSNAIYAMPNRGKLRIEAYPAPSGAFCLKVTDEGEGMSEEVAGKVLEPFFTTKPVGSGTGLGLATVAAIVKGWKGSIEINSAPQNGTQITITVPQSSDLQQAGTDLAPSSLGSKGPNDDYDFALSPSREQFPVRGPESARGRRC